MLLRLVQELPRLEELRVKPLSVSAEACSASVVFNALTLQSQAVRRGERIAACTSSCDVLQASETCSEWTNNFTVASYFLVGVLLRLVHALPQLEGSRVKLLSVSAKACSRQHVFNALTLQSHAVRRCKRISACTSSCNQWPCVPG